jgi:sugar lactone lactonase YvrE
VNVYDRSGKRVGELKPPASTGVSHVPVYVAVNPTDGGVYVSDRATAAIYIYDQSGRYLRSFTPRSKVDGGFAPLGLAFDSSGLLYTTDVSGRTHRVLVFGADGSLQRAMGRPGELLFPNGLVVDSRGNVAVSDSNNGRLLVFDPTGQVIATVTRGVGEGDLGLPRGVATGDGGRLYVVDTSNHAIRVYRMVGSKAPTPKYIASFGEEGTLDGRFEFPNGVATDSRARIYVTDRENNRVQVWSY